ncbi:hypothetical protein IFM47457_04500 [Aspergillus lentulus]|nr:hypothetical protein IFM47457_04500 [Aspergillus lentulus]
MPATMAGFSRRPAYHRPTRQEGHHDPIGAGLAIKPSVGSDQAPVFGVGLRESARLQNYCQ